MSDVGQQTQVQSKKLKLDNQHRGQDIQNQITSHIKIFYLNTYQETWKPQVRDGATLICIQNHLYYIGGSTGFIHQNLNYLNFSDWKWSIINDLKLKWNDSNKSYMTMKLPPRANHTSLVYNKNQIIIYGGEESFNEKLNVKVIGKETIVLNTENMIWKVLECQYEAKYFVNPRRNHAAGMAGKGQMIVLGGISDSEQQSYLGDFAVLDMVNLTWRDFNSWIRDKTIPYKQGLAHHQISIVFEDKVNQQLFGPKNIIKNANKTIFLEPLIKDEGLYLFGGLQGSGEQLEGLWLLKSSINDKIMEWRLVNSKGQQPQSRYSHSMTYMKYINCLVIYGGMTNSYKQTTFLNDLHIFNLKNQSWLEVEIYGFIKPQRCKHTACDSKSQLIIYGGINSDGYLNSDICVIEFDQKYVKEYLVHNNNSQSIQYRDEFESQSKPIHDEAKQNQLKQQKKIFITKRILQKKPDIL